MDKGKFTVLVTRPRHQANELSQMIQQRDWKAVVFPTIEIRPLSILDVPDITDFDSLIFISRNAVDAALTYWSIESLNSKSLIAVGATTAHTLESAGASNVQFVDGQANSERLLAMPILQDSEVRNKKLLILSGLGGRDVLAETLSERGAEIQRLALYERHRPCYDGAEIKQLWECLPDIIVITSNESADNLAEIMQTTAYYQSMLAIQTVVMSERIGQHVAELGFLKDSAVAETTDNLGLIAAIDQCFNEVKRE